MIQDPVALVEKAKLLPTHEHLRRQDVPGARGEGEVPMRGAGELAAGAGAGPGMAAATIGTGS